MKSCKICVFWIMTRFLLKNGGLNGWAIIGVLLKSIEKNVTKIGTTENKKSRKCIKKSLKHDVLQSTMSQRYGNYFGLGKSRVGEKMRHPENTRRSGSPFQRKRWKFDVHSGPIEIRRGTNNLTFSVRTLFEGINF